LAFAFLRTVEDEVFRQIVRLLLEDLPPIPRCGSTTSACRGARRDPGQSLRQQDAANQFMPILELKFGAPRIPSPRRLARRRPGGLVPQFLDFVSENLAAWINL
jgi:hypothetical protein